jgi:hypothetical protein
MKMSMVRNSFRVEGVFKKSAATAKEASGKHMVTDECDRGMSMAWSFAPCSLTLLIGGRFGRTAAALGFEKARIDPSFFFLCM